MDILILGPIILPILSGLLLKILKIEDRKQRQVYLTASLIANIGLLFYVFSLGDLSLELFRLNSILSLSLKIDALARFFSLLASFLWLMAGIYSFEYMKAEGSEGRYYSFLMINLGILVAIAFSANLFTFYLFYEFMTLLSFPLVIHSMTKEAMKAGVMYLVYSFFGAALVLLSIFFLSSYAASYDFLAGGILDAGKLAGKEDLLRLTYLLAFIGFGGKAGLFPLHAWLPKAHPVAPAPASGLLSGIITKAGVLGIIRMTYYAYGPDLIRNTWAHTAILSLIIFTIFMGSMRAFKSELLKERLAYSSVSQVSYVLFGIASLNQIGFIGGLLHMVFHALIKNVLFLSVGVIIYKTGKTRVDQVKGLGKSMPITMLTFSLASLALIGIPPLSGFVSKWYLAMGGLDLGSGLGILGVVTLLVSALLTAGYLIPIFRDAFFPGSDFDYASVEKLEPNAYMTWPLGILTLALVGFGIWPVKLIDYILSFSQSLF